MPASRALKSASIVNDEAYDGEVGDAVWKLERAVQTRRGRMSAGGGELTLHPTWLRFFRLSLDLDLDLDLDLEGRESGEGDDVVIVQKSLSNAPKKTRDLERG